MLGGITAVQQVTTVIINFQTPDLSERAVVSFRKYYPDRPLLLIDNGSRDHSVTILSRLHRESPKTITLLLNKNNLHHGPAMDQALRQLESAFVLFLDSDCAVLQGGFIEPMLEALSGKQECYVIGQRTFMNKRGFDVSGGADSTPYIRPICMLVKRELYLSLPPFERHGTPCLANMRAARERGLELLHFSIEEFIDHKGRGTAGRFGYNLGWKGKWNYLLNRFGL